MTALIAKWAIVVVLVFGVGVSVGTVGQPRKPLTPGVAVAVVVVNAAIIISIILFWRTS